MSSTMVVSNHLPITITKNVDSLTYAKIVGGLTAGLFSYKNKKDIELSQKIIEIKDAWIHKLQAKPLFVARHPYDFIFIAGDDVTDETMFKALPKTVSFKIGEGFTSVQHRLYHLQDLTKILEALLTSV